MDTDQAIYRYQADRYEQLVAREDFQGNLLRSITKILPLAGLDVLELGAGTGRVTRLLAPRVHAILALDSSLPMLKVAGNTTRGSKQRNVALAAADHRLLPIKTCQFDLAISGWSICYLVSPGAVDPYPDWQTQVGASLDEMARSLRPGGTILIIETLGTGFEQPHPPDHLKAYYRYLEVCGFTSTWLRTDYRFKSIEEAQALTRFFFGEALAQEVAEKDWVVLPECTGIWWRKET